jgi:Flp pilus assembly pilin Flp
MGYFLRFIRDERAATSIKYGLIAGLIGVVVITTVRAVRGEDVERP